MVEGEAVNEYNSPPKGQCIRRNQRLALFISKINSAYMGELIIEIEKGQGGNSTFEAKFWYKNKESVCLNTIDECVLGLHETNASVCHLHHTNDRTTETACCTSSGLLRKKRI